MKRNYMKRHIRICIYIGICLLLPIFLNIRKNCPNVVWAKENAKHETHHVYEEDNRLEPGAHETYDYEQNPAKNYIYNRHTWVAKRYSEEEMAETSHAYFDGQNRLRYSLGYSSAILGSRPSYCEENIYEWNDKEHTCRYIYYKSNSMPYDSGYYVPYRYLFEVCCYQFDESNRLLKKLTYSRNAGSDWYGYSEELFFNRGYRAEYDGEKLMAELQYQDYWGSNKYGVWEYRIYQYNDNNDCILKAAVTEDNITLSCYEYDNKAGTVDEYTYLVKEDWELKCDNGSVIYFSAIKGPAVKKVSADGTVEKELYYGRAAEMGQQHYLMPEDIEDTIDDHKYTVKPGDCLWNIAYKYYGHGTYYNILHRANLGVIGPDENLIEPGMRLFIPEAGNAQDTIIR